MVELVLTLLSGKVDCSWLIPISALPVDEVDVIVLSTVDKVDGIIALDDDTFSDSVDVEFISRDEFISSTEDEELLFCIPVSTLVALLCPIRITTVNPTLFTFP